MGERMREQLLLAAVVHSTHVSCILMIHSFVPLTLIFLLIKNMGVDARMVVVSKVSKW